MGNVVVPSSAVRLAFSVVWKHFTKYRRDVSRLSDRKIYSIHHA